MIYTVLKRNWRRKSKELYRLMSGVRVFKMFSTTMITVLELEYTWRKDGTFSADCVEVKGINEVKGSL